MKAIPSGVTGLLFLLTFFWSACEKSTTIGSGIFPPGSQLISARTDTMTIRMYTVQDDPSFSTDLAENLLGSDDDPVYGRSRASVYTQFSLPTSDFDFAPETVTIRDSSYTVGSYLVDSLVLSLRVVGFQGNETVPQSFEVYKLTDYIRKGTSYEANDDFATESTPVGSLTDIIPRPEDSVLVGDLKLPPQVRIRLDTDLAQDLLDKSGERELESNDVFRSYFPGLFVKSTGAHGRGFFRVNMQSANTRLTLYYRRVIKTERYRVDALSASFPVSTSSATVARYSHDHSGAQAIENLGAPPPGENDSVLYFQGMGGLKIKLEVPHLEDFKGLALNRATLRFPLLPYEEGVEDTSFARPSEAMLIRARRGSIGFETLTTDRNYTDDTVTIQNTTTAELPFHTRPRDSACRSCANSWAEFIPSAGLYRSVIDQFFSGFDYGGPRTTYNIPGVGDVDGYEFNLTLEFQAILNGDVENNGFLLIPFPYFRIASRGRIGGFYHPDLKRRAQIEIIYTEVN